MNHTLDHDLLVVLRHGPHGSDWLREGLDAALVAAAFGRRVSLLFLDEGVTALIEGQSAGALGQKGTAPTLAMLEMYDIDRLLVDPAGLAAYGLVDDDLMVPVCHVETPELPRLFAEHRLVMTF